MIQRANKGRTATAIIAASDAAPKSRKGADYVCDGSGDQGWFNDTITDLPNNVGLIQLTDGNFSLDDEILGAESVNIVGLGRGITNITQTAENKAAFNFADCDFNTIRELSINMPSSNSGDAIIVGSQPILKQIRLSGGSQSAYGVRVSNSFGMNLEGISGQIRMNGILIENSDNVDHYGNGKISNIFFSLTAGLKGLSLVGYRGGKKVNLMEIDGINIATGATKPNNCVGIYLDTAYNCEFGMLDIEGVDNGIQGISASNNKFNAYFFNNVTTEFSFDTSSIQNILKGGPFSTISNSSNNYRLYQQNRCIGLPIHLKYANEFIFEDNFIGAGLRPEWNTSGLYDISENKIKLTTGAVNGDKARLDFNNHPVFSDTYGTYFEAKVRRGDANGYSVRFGLTDGDFAASNIGAWWRQEYGNGNLYACCCDGSTLNATDTNIGRGTTAHTYGILKMTTGIGFYYDGTLKNTLSSNIPGLSTLREPVFEIETKEDVAHKMYVDYVRVVEGKGFSS